MLGRTNSIGFVHLKRLYKMDQGSLLLRDGLGKVVQGVVAVNRKKNRGVNHGFGLKSTVAAIRTWLVDR